MQDLQLFSLLASKNPPPEKLLPLLEDLALLPAQQRFPYLNRLRPLLNHSQWEVRREVIACFEDAKGFEGEEIILEAMRDDHPEVRQAAVEVFDQQGHRWIHPLYSPFEDIRHQALVYMPANETTLTLAAYQLTDPASQDLLWKRLREFHQKLRFPEARFVLPLWKKGDLSLSRARKLIIDLFIKDYYCFWKLFGPLDLRPFEEVARRLDFQKSPPTTWEEEDEVDHWIELLWADWHCEEEENPVQKFLTPDKCLFSKILAHHWNPGQAPLAREQRHLLHLGAALLHRARLNEDYPLKMVEALLLISPHFFTCPEIPLSRRREAISIYGKNENWLEPFADEAIEKLVKHPAFWIDDTRVHLPSVAALLKLVKDHPYEKIEKWLGNEVLIESFGQAPSENLVFFQIPELKEPYRKLDLFHEIYHASDMSRASYLYYKTLIVPSDRLDFLNRISREEGWELLEKIAEEEEKKSPRVFNENKLQKVASALAVKLVLRSPSSSSSPSESLARLVNLWRYYSHSLLPIFEVLFVEVAQLMSIPRWKEAFSHLEEETLASALEVMDLCTGIPVQKEKALIETLDPYDHPSIVNWRKEREEIYLPQAFEKFFTPASEGVRELPSSLQEKIATISESNLFALLRKHALVHPTLGLADALARRPDPTAPHMGACLALMGCHDEYSKVWKELGRYSTLNKKFLHRLEVAAVKTWRGGENLPLWTHLWLSSWAFHRQCVVKEIRSKRTNLLEILKMEASPPFPPLEKKIWQAVHNLLSTWRWRDPHLLEEYLPPEVAEILLQGLERKGIAKWAAKLLKELYLGEWKREYLEKLIPRILEIIPQLSPSIANHLYWTDGEDLIQKKKEKRPKAKKKDLPQVKVDETDDLQEILRHCYSPEPSVASEGAIALAERGEEGQKLLAKALMEDQIPCFREIVPVISFFSSQTLTLLVPFVQDSHSPSEKRFLIGFELLERGEEDLEGHLWETLEARGNEWMKSADWSRLKTLGYSEEELACRLHLSPQSFAYIRSVNFLLTEEMDQEKREGALKEFLDQEGWRSYKIRKKAGVYLFQKGYRQYFPLMVSEFFYYQMKNSVTITDLLELLKPVLKSYPSQELTEFFTEILEGACLCLPNQGESFFWKTFLLLHSQGSLPTSTFRTLCEFFLHRGKDGNVKEEALKALGRQIQKSPHFQRLVDLFAWGVEEGFVLLKKKFRIHLLTDDQLGYTRLKTSQIFVSPLPYLEGAPRGADIVRGLIVHEYGHHIYHKEEGGLEVWERAGEKNLHHLLNLVADEHLERNLRSQKEKYGNYLKRLASYAFQHSQRAVPVELLLRSLKEKAFPLLTNTPLGLAEKYNEVILETGDLLYRLEREGSSFGRFVKALRMGLGNRHGDPQVAEALKLFKGKKFANSTMEELWEITLKVAKIFPGAARMIKVLDQGSLGTSREGQIILDSEGIRDEILQEEVEKALRKKEDSEKGIPKMAINLSQTRDFPLIPRVEKVPFDPTRHRYYVQKVASLARQMAEFFKNLGLDWESVKGRTRGKSLDLARLRRSLLTQSPRILKSRRKVYRTDLFLGLLIDCSGSMSIDDRLETAKLFGTLLSEAACGIRGVEVRIFGFTDEVILDCGNSERCSIHNLETAGGNNDAGALWHAAQIAQKSRHTARMLVMISDGAPTECSVTALRDLVRELEQKRHILCAQVAVREMEEICFSHYVLIDEADFTQATRRFGQMIVRLIRQVL